MNFMRDWRNDHSKDDLYGDNYCKDEPETLNPKMVKYLEYYKNQSPYYDSIYMNKHPEIKALIEAFLCSALKTNKNTPGFIFEHMKKFFSKSVKELNVIARKRLEESIKQCYKDGEKIMDANKVRLKLLNIMIDARMKEFATYDIMSPIHIEHTPSSVSMSEFSSLLSSDTTNVEICEEIVFTLEMEMEIFFWSALNKATSSVYERNDIVYDTCFVMVMSTVERAMEIPVIPIVKDINDMWKIMMLKLDAEINKLENAKIVKTDTHQKKKRRIVRGFKGYAPEEDKSAKLKKKPEEVKPMVYIADEDFKPVVTKYNRYPKDEYGVYLPQIECSPVSVSIEPVIPVKIATSLAKLTSKTSKLDQKN